jgi:hypothetical protein
VHFYWMFHLWKHTRCAAMVIFGTRIRHETETLPSLSYSYTKVQHDQSWSNTLFVCVVMVLSQLYPLVCRATMLSWLYPFCSINDLQFTAHPLDTSSRSHTAYQIICQPSWNINPENLVMQLKPTLYTSKVFSSLSNQTQNRVLQHGMWFSISHLW